LDRQKKPASSRGPAFALDRQFSFDDVPGDFNQAADPNGAELSASDQLINRPGRDFENLSNLGNVEYRLAVPLRVEKARGLSGSDTAALKGDMWFHPVW
jgi:hypothetical protein